MTHPIRISTRFARHDRHDRHDPHDPHDSLHVRQAIARARQGDLDALHFLYVRYADSVRGYVGSIVHDSHDAEDITQTLFLNLTRKIRRYEPHGVPFAAWILRVARNAALDHLRGRRAIPVEEVRISQDRHDGQDEEGFARQESLRTAFERLPGDQREVVVLRHIAGLSPGEIALRMGKTESAVHGLHHRGRSALKAALSELEAAPMTAA